MANTLQIKRGNKVDLPTLAAGEFGFASDTDEIFIGNGASNVQILTEDWVTASVGDPGSDTSVPSEQAVREALSALGLGDLSGDLDDIDNGTTYVKSHNDFTDNLLSKLNGIEESANNYSLPVAGASIGGVKEGGDILIDALGVITVNDDSHNHIISNVDGLQTSLDNKAVSGGAEHDGFSDFVANEHINHTSVTLTAGTGLTGGGTIASNRTFDVDVGIGNDKIVQMDDTDAVSGDYAKFTANGLQGRSAAEVRSDINVDVSGTINYTHPSYAGDDFSIDTGHLSGATVIDDLDINLTTDSQGHVTDANATVATRNLTLANLGYTGATDANNYTHPSYAGDDINVDTGALSGATVVSDVDINVTTDTQGHVTDANGVVQTRTITLADIGCSDLSTLYIPSWDGLNVKFVDSVMHELTGGLGITGKLHVDNLRLRGDTDWGAINWYEKSGALYVKSAELSWNTTDALLEIVGCPLSTNSIYLNGETSSNHELDDYEEGTYTVTCTPDASGTVTLNSTSDTLSYIKVGHLVTVEGKIIVDSVSSPIGTIIFSLPFSVASLSENAVNSAGSIAVKNLDLDAGYTQINPYVSTGNGFKLLQSQDNGNWNIFGASNTLSGNEELYINLSYRTA